MMRTVLAQKMAPDQQRRDGLLGQEAGTGPENELLSAGAELMKKRSGWTPERKARQAEAIRRWAPWTRSSGPRTTAGKAVSARNAVMSPERLKTHLLLLRVHRELAHIHRAFRESDLLRQAATRAARLKR